MGRTSDADERLKDAALALMWEESYGAVTIDDICKRADVKKGSFYYFFPDKAHLAVAALEKMWIDDWKPMMDERFSPSIEPLMRFAIQMEALYLKQSEIKARTGKILGCPVCSVGSEISTQEVDVSAKIREILSRKRRYYESAIRDAVAEGSIETCDPVQKAMGIMALMEGSMSQSRIMNDPEILRSLPATVFDFLRLKPGVTVPAPVAVR